ncbi:hypothetical protein [Legionella saoudiensis]|uniref:hypothetical protein n=1 Tax=Legionella saoudiensis TaxID=1750561 RepID=UPI000730F210|nr:hypothetical protein [Legionella saoudiensis]
MGLNDGKAQSAKLTTIKLNGGKRQRSASEGFDRAQYDLKDFGTVIPVPPKSSTHGFLSHKSRPTTPTNSPAPEPSPMSYNN